MRHIDYKFFVNRINELKRNRLALIKKELAETALKKKLADLDESLATNINLLRAFDNTELSDIIT